MEDKPAIRMICTRMFGPIGFTMVGTSFMGLGMDDDAADIFDVLTQQMLDGRRRPVNRSNPGLRREKTVQGQVQSFLAL